MKPPVHSLIRWGSLAPLALLGACQPTTAPTATVPVVWVSPATPVADTDARVFPAVLVPRIESPVGFRVGGRVAMRLVETGQQVRAGQTLAELNTDDLVTGQQAARQQVLGAETELAQLQQDEARLARLSVDGSAPAAELERQRTRVRAAQVRLEAARQGEQLAANRVAHAVLKAPFDGVVLQVMADVGQVLPEGQAMFMLARSGEAEAEVFLPEDLAAQARQVAAQLVLTGGSPTSHKPMPLTVREVAPMGTPPTRQVRVRYSLAVPAGQTLPWRWGQTAEVRWPAASSGVAMAVPAGALVLRDQAPHVWVVSRPDNRLVRQPVVVRRHTTDGVVVDGVPRGARVVSVGAQKLVAGTLVAPRERSHTHLDVSTGSGAQP